MNNINFNVKSIERLCYAKEKKNSLVHISQFYARTHCDLIKYRLTFICRICVCVGLSKACKTCVLRLSVSHTVCTSLLISDSHASIKP